METGVVAVHFVRIFVQAREFDVLIYMGVDEWSCGWWWEMR
jgi:hypothetical protein